MPAAYELKINRKQINLASRRAFGDLVLLLGRKFTEVISDDRQWPGFPDSRDIVDKGILRSSQIPLIEASLYARFIWPVFYALYVHEGYTLRNGRQIEGRPWTTIAIEEIDITATFAKLYKLYS